MPYVTANIALNAFGGLIYVENIDVRREVEFDRYGDELTAGPIEVCRDALTGRRDEWVEIKPTGATAELFIAAEDALARADTSEALAVQRSNERAWFEASRRETV